MDTMERCRIVLSLFDPLFATKPGRGPTPPPRSTMFGVSNDTLQRLTRWLRGVCPGVREISVLHQTQIGELHAVSITDYLAGRNLPASSTVAFELVAPPKSFSKEILFRVMNRGYVASLTGMHYTNVNSILQEANQRIFKYSVVVRFFTGATQAIEFDAGDVDVIQNLPADLDLDSWTLKELRRLRSTLLCADGTRAAAVKYFKQLQSTARKRYLSTLKAYRQIGKFSTQLPTLSKGCMFSSSSAVGERYKVKALFNTGVPILAALQWQSHNVILRPIFSKVIVGDTIVISPGWWDLARDVEQMSPLASEFALGTLIRVEALLKREHARNKLLTGKIQVNTILPSVSGVLGDKILIPIEGGEEEILIIGHLEIGTRRQLNKDTHTIDIRKLNQGAWIVEAIYEHPVQPAEEIQNPRIVERPRNRLIVEPRNERIARIPAEPRFEFQRAPPVVEEAGQPLQFQDGQARGIRFEERNNFEDIFIDAPDDNNP